MHILYLYPNLLNLHGDRANILAFIRIGKLMGVNVTYDIIDDFEKKIDFDKYDLVMISPGELITIEEILKYLFKQKKDILSYLDRKKYIICIGTSASLFSNTTKRCNGTSFKGLGIGNFDCIERDKVLGDDIIFNFDKHKVVGSQIQMIDIVAKEDNTLGDIIYGYGNYGNGREGIRYNNLIITNTLGPLFVKNPWLVEDIIKDITGKNKYKKIDYSLEEKSMEEIILFNQTKS